ncbi:GlxA family transcriptional regulator [Photobacterium nomapromontoriensis]|uniref:GlxA family transcriptional regulator n=1 Tax=Photobacterium nomapromontoriensis TaxID=2910237 RepID=UPI003D146C6B
MWHISILNYESAMRSAIYGIEELFTLANRMAPSPLFHIELCDYHQSMSTATQRIIFIPPCFADPLPTFENSALTMWLQKNADDGVILAASCVGVFWLGRAGLLNGKTVTTHWRLCEKLAQQFPAIRHVEKRDMVVDQGEIVTAAGLFAFQDLVLHLIARLAGYDLAKQVADFSLLDLNGRLQAYYERFSPNIDHGDTLILQAQRLCETDPTLSVKQLADLSFISERTLYRRFMAATGLSPKQYLVESKIELARTLLSTSSMSVEKVAHHLGYLDVSNFNRTFGKVTGMTPAGFKARQLA